jgi:eukaryotic-like serine/threonine-protein kinase
MTAGAEPHELVSKLGPFLITRVLGRGGMGIVYAGKHERTGVEVALKTVSAGSTAFMSYVRHEASTLSRIRHPGVVQILGMGVEAGRPWYAMEILSGRTLSGFLAIDEVARGRMQGAEWTHTATSNYVSQRVSMARARAEREAERQAEHRAERAVLAQQDLATLPLAQTAQLGPIWPSGTPGSIALLGEESARSEAQRDGAPRGASEQIEQPPLPPQKPIACDLARMLPILRGICNALSFVHGEGVVHRDLKPDNIFICTGELPVLVDFGLASHVSADGRDVLENVGRVAGSVGYMAPEQLRGELIDARCDLYALGCILYQLVTGHLPFEGSASRIIAGHLIDEPMPPGQLVTGLPTALDELIRGLLAKERDQRVGSAESVDDVLASIGGAPCRWATPLPAPLPFLYRPPFVGREGVLGQLVERLQQFSAAAQRTREENDDLHERGEPAGGLILIAGESGAGKTRLALEAVKLGTESSALTISCGCAAGGSPLQPLRELFRALVEHCIATDSATELEGASQRSDHPTHRPTGDTGENRSAPATTGGPVDARTAAGSESQRVLGGGAAVLALYSPELAELPWVAELPEPEPLPSVAARARVFRTLTHALRELARTCPLLLTLDDLHLADGFTLELLAHLQAEHAGGTGPRMLVLCTYRSEERSTALEGLVALPGTLHLVVERMSELEVGQMVRGMLALPDPPTAFVSFLARESGGNPFFVAEYLRTAVAERVLVRDGRGRWRIADTSVPTEEVCEALPLPRSLRQVVELRLGKLAPRTRQVLDAAAVIGRRFASALLAAVVPISEEALLEALDEMVAAQVLEPVDDRGYRFAHDKLHELPAAAQAPAQRRDLHARIAAAMERLYGEGAEHEGTIGRHWAAGGYPERAARRLGSAGDHARKVHSVDTAIELYRAARREVELVLVDAEAAHTEKRRDTAGNATSWHAQAGALDEKLGDALAFSSQHALARDAFEAARQHLGVDQPILRARLLRKIAKSWESVHAYPEALAGYAELEALLVATPQHMDELEPEWIHLMLGRAWIYYWSNRVDEMNEAIDLVRPMLEARGTPLDRYRFYLALVTRDYRRDRFRVSAETLEFGRECVAAAREANSPSEIAFARFVHGFGLLFAGQLHGAEGEIDAALQTARRISDAVVETRSIAYLAMLHCLTGNVGEAQATATAALEMSRARKMGDYEAMSLALLGRLAHMAGDAAKAADLCLQATAIWNAMMAYPFPFRWIAGLPMLQQGLGRLAEPEGADLPALVELARELCAANQHHLPDPLDAALRAAVDIQSDTQDAESARVIEAHLRRAIALAYQLGYMRESP